MPTQAEIEDFVRRNGEQDRGRAVEALTNYTGDRDFDSQSNMYDQRTNQLSAAGREATARIVRPQPRGAAPMGGGTPNPYSYTMPNGSTVPYIPFVNPYANGGNAYLMPHGVRPQPRTLGDVTGLDPRSRGGR